jgi:hypothetical protein
MLYEDFVRRGELFRTFVMEELPEKVPNLPVPIEEFQQQANKLIDEQMKNYKTLINDIIKNAPQGEMAPKFLADYARLISGMGIEDIISGISEANPPLVEGFTQPKQSKNAYTTAIGMKVKSLNEDGKEVTVQNMFSATAVVGQGLDDDEINRFIDQWTQEVGQ